MKVDNDEAIFMFKLQLQEEPNMLIIGQNILKNMLIIDQCKRDGKVAFYVIHSRWLGPNYVITIALEAAMALQMSAYEGGKRAWNWEKYVACHVKYHIILGNLMEYGYQGLDPGSKV